MKRKILLILALAIVVLPLVLSPLSVSAATSWLSGWSYRTLHTMNGATAAGTGYQVRVVVHSGAGVDAGDDIYLDNHCTDFPQDITFTDNDKTTELSFFAENITADPCVFWVRINDSLSSPATASFYTYYGKTGQTTESNGRSTFPLLFDGWDAQTYGSWSLGTNLPTVRFSVSATPSPLFGGNIYIIGGWDAGALMTNSTTIYNIAGNSYSSGASYPGVVGIAGSSQVLLGGKIYVFGGVISGASYTTNLRIYDIAADSWSSGTNIPWAAEGMFAIADSANNDIYVGGGCELPVALHDEWYVYHTTTDTWTSKGVMPSTRGNGVGVLYNGNIYVTAGGGVTGTTWLTSTWRYNIASSTWTTGLSPIPIPTNLPGYDLHSASGRIYVFGGKTAISGPSYVYTNATQVYDIATDTWLSNDPDYTYLPVPAAYAYASGRFNGNTFYLIGGWDGTTRYNTMRRDDISVSTYGAIDSAVWNSFNVTSTGSYVRLAGPGSYIQSVDTFQDNKATMIRAYVNSAMGNVAMLGSMENLVGTLDYAFFNPRTSVLAWTVGEKGAAADIDVLPTFYDAPHTFEMGRLSTNVTFYQDGVAVSNVTNPANVPANPGAVAIKTGQTGFALGPIIDVDWAAVRSYVDPEPTHGAWGAEEISPFPIIHTVAASSVALSSARLNSVLDWDGGNPCVVRFGWGNATSATMAGYQHLQTLTGTYSAGDHPYLDITGLNISTTYYFRADATNVDGTTAGGELNFTTLATLGAIQNFKGVPSATSISLSWDTLPGASDYLIRYAFDDFPALPTSGSQAYYGSSTSTVHTGLTSGRTFYYTLWGTSGGVYSINATLMMTVSAGVGSVDVDYLPATEIPRWLSGMDYTRVSGLGFVYDIVNGVAGAISMPYASAWFIVSLSVSVIFGLVAYIKSRGKLMIGVIVMDIFFVTTWLMGIMVFWVPLIGGGILIFAAYTSHREVAKG